MDVFRTPDERFEGLPGYEFEPHYADVDGLRLHYLDEGDHHETGRSSNIKRVAPAEHPPKPERPRMSPVVCFHGEPTWGYLYRKMLPPLVAAGHRVICPDYAGFGRSDKPTDPDWYSFSRHSELVSSVLAELDLTDVVVVVQDWGGPIGLTWAVENADRVRALVILNTGLFLGRVSKGFLAWRDFAERNPDLPVGFIVQGATGSEVPEDVVGAYEAPFPNPESKAGAAQFPLLVPMSEDAPMAVQQREVQDALSRWEKPALVAFSDQDPVFPYPKGGERFVELIPTVEEQVKIEGAAHFLQEDRGELIAEHMLRTLA